jgi:hypothetical protein
MALRKVPTTYEELRRRVEDDGGVHATRAQVLRDIEGAGRLGSNVRADISRKLESRGMAHLPEELPQYQEEEVVIYLRDSAVAPVVQAVLNPSQSTAVILRQLADNGAQDTIRKIRQLIGPDPE